MPRRKGFLLFALVIGLLGLAGGYLIGTRRELIPTLERPRTSTTELDSRSRDEPYKRAQAIDLPGRSNMSKEELQEALAADVKTTEV